MKWIRHTCLLLFVTLYALRPMAQTSATAADQQPWSLQQCLDYAHQHNLQINTLRLSEEAARQDVVAAHGAQTPSLSATAGNTFTNANNSDGSSNGNLVNQLTSSGIYTLSSGIVLWNDGLIRNTIRQKDLLNQSAGLTVQQSENSITLQITQAYLNILLAKENQVYVENLVSTSDSIVTQAQLLYSAGSIAKAALLQLQAQLASDKYTLVQTQNAVRQNTMVLKQLLQLPSSTWFDVAAPQNLQVMDNVSPLGEVQDAALNNFPDSKIGKLGVDIASLNIANAQAAFKPVLKANAALGSSYASVLTNTVVSKPGYLTQAGNNFYQQAGVTLAIPIFSQKVNKTNLEKSKIAYRQSVYDQQNTQLVLSQAVEQAYIAAENAMQSYKAAGEQLQAATESYRIGNAEFKLGAINAYDLLQQRNQYIQAVQAYTQSKYTAVLQQKVYEFYMNSNITL